MQEGSHVYLKSQKMKTHHHLLTLELFQTFMSFFLLLNILKNVANQVPIDFHSMENFIYI